MVEQEPIPQQTQTDLDQKAFRYIAETGMLMQMPRSHQRHLGNTFDTVASHSFHAAVIAYALTRLEGLSHLEGLNAMAMSTLHDIPEARTGDLDYVEKHYANVDEVKAIKDQLRGLPGEEDLAELYTQWLEQKTPASLCAKDADALEQRYQEWVLMYEGSKLAEKWYSVGFKHRVPHYRTESAKRLAMIMDGSHPHEWWFTDLVDGGINHQHLNDLALEEPEG